MSKTLIIITISLLATGFTRSQHLSIDRHQPERIEWFRDAGFGLMITWSPDVLLGAEISMSLEGASKAYQDMYFNQLLKAFNPEGFDPDQWAGLASISGAKYVVITAKHHNGFCMWDTKTTDFSIMNTGYGRDILKEIIEAFRKYDIAIGLSYAVSDFHVLYKQGHPVSLKNPLASPAVNSALWEINKIQLRELLGNYGKIDILSIEDKADWANPLVANFAWDLEPELVITGAGMETQAFFIPKESKKAPWEMRINAGYHHQYVEDDHFKTSGSVLNMLVETRAKGGNFLLNISPDAHGAITQNQQIILRQTGNWLLANGEAVTSVRPAPIIQENGTWFTQSKDGKIIYAFITQTGWKWPEERAFFFRALKGSKNTKVTVPGQYDTGDNKLWPYPPAISVVDEGIFVGRVRKQQFNKTNNYPVVLRFEGIEIRE